MARDLFNEGDVVRLQATFTDINDTLIDPTMVHVRYQPPGGTTVEKMYNTDEEVKRASLGVYYIDVPADEGGTWVYRWIATGTDASACESFFNVVAATI